MMERSFENTPITSARRFTSRWSDGGQGDAMYDLATLTLAHEKHLYDVMAGHWGHTEIGVIRAYWSLRNLMEIRWVVSTATGRRRRGMLARIKDEVASELSVSRHAGGTFRSPGGRRAVSAGGPPCPFTSQNGSRIKRHNVLPLA
jgi:hypothetical protein